MLYVFPPPNAVKQRLFTVNQTFSSPPKTSINRARCVSLLPRALNKTSALHGSLWWKAEAGDPSRPRMYVRPKGIIMAKIPGYYAPLYPRFEF